MTKFPNHQVWSKLSTHSLHYKNYRLLITGMNILTQLTELSQKNMKKIICIMSIFLLSLVVTFSNPLVAQNADSTSMVHKATTDTKEDHEDYGKWGLAGLLGLLGLLGLRKKDDVVITSRNSSTPTGRTSSTPTRP